jgi:predicted transglutaminase-like cysteine proteinase
MPKRLFLLSIVCAALVAAAAPAAAGALQVDFSNPAFAPTTGPTSIPVGHAEFCKSHRDECRPNSRAVPVEMLNQSMWQQLIDVNNSFNAAIVPETDEELYHVAEFWTYPSNGAGDCEDIALAKRRQLLADGWDASTLLMTVVKEANGDGHAVLMVRTDRGDLVLDNQQGRILVWNETPYRYVKRQSQEDAGKWVGIDDTHPILIAASN